MCTAIDTLNDTDFQGRSIVVRYDAEPPKREPEARRHEVKEKVEAPRPVVPRKAPAPAAAREPSANASEVRGLCYNCKK